LLNGLSTQPVRRVSVGAERSAWFRPLCLQSFLVSLTSATEEPRLRGSGVPLHSKIDGDDDGAA
jgi:hypothetical protein